MRNTNFVETLKSEVVKDRKNGDLSKREARESWDVIEELGTIEHEDQLWGFTGQMREIMGDEWWYRLPKKANPDYEYLCRIIKAVQAALRETEGKKSC